MKKKTRIILKLIALNFEKDFAYRWNFLATLMSSLAYLTTFILGLDFLFSKVGLIGNYSFDQLYVLLMFSQLWWYVNMMFAARSFGEIARLINNGQLDYFLLKPIQFRWITPFLVFGSRDFVPLSVTFILMLFKLNIFALNFDQIIAALFFFLNGVIISYSIISILTTLVFFSGRNSIAGDVIFEFPDLIKIPANFFIGTLKPIFTFLIPITIILNPTFQILYNKIDWKLLVTAVLMNIILFIISETFWKIGLKNYTSAN
jgi:ABC-2 type transport system permease protein